MSDKELYHKLLRPHLEREVRKHLGSPDGNLRCEICGSMNASKNIQRTQYADEESNYSTLCPQCQDMTDEYWDEMWNEYYLSIL